ncbi:hypothetical protein QCE62_06965 [Caballeronia sp. LZ033]|uniref:hypothetical protein n=1 Tax=Caballeronia sp. LZ033 TaxID=3038566 RepID=UPI00285D1858|nr:hypothetical protein [Caballeronia sp. LZ033]MDR5813332.1 hypothetical protein [Caballeronia sp. LZ033]
MSRAFNDLERKQLPFATATALTSLAKLVRDEEVDNLAHTFASPTPFTLRSVGVTAARKATMQSTVYVKDIAAAYLQPYEFGGVHKLNGRALLNPKNTRLNQYGNLPRNTLARLKSQSDVVVGSVTFKSSGETVSGVWSRPPKEQQVATKRAGRRGKNGNLAVKRGGLKLLIRFGDALPVHEHLDYRARAAAIINKNFDREFSIALRKAMTTARK